MVNSHINDWNLTRLQPWVRKRYGLQARQKQAVEAQAAFEMKMSQAQAEIDRNLGRAVEAIARTTKQLDELARVQAAVGRRISELVDFEKQYRGFLEAKSASVAPPGLQAPEHIGNGRLETSHIDNAALEDGI
jgi:superfamily II RNA helicase